MLSMGCLVNLCLCLLVGWMVLIFLFFFLLLWGERGGVVCFNSLLQRQKIESLARQSWKKIELDYERQEIYVNNKANSNVINKPLMSNCSFFFCRWPILFQHCKRVLRALFIYCWGQRKWLIWVHNYGFKNCCGSKSRIQEIKFERELIIWWKQLHLIGPAD